MSAAVKPLWGPVGPNLLPGAEISVLQDDPAQSALFTVRLKMPKGYVVAPQPASTDDEWIRCLSHDESLGSSTAD